MSPIRRTYAAFNVLVFKKIFRIASNVTCTM
jgi:hypothetical protein